jgi:15-cis-phytoene desaturase
LYLKFDRKVTDRRFWARTHREGDLNCDFYDLSNIRPSLKNGPSVVASNIIYSHRVAAMSEQEILDRTLFELRENIPGTREAKLVASTVNRIPMAIHCPKPGAESLRPEPALIPGRFHLAGDWVRTELPSSMESACASGWMAARGILESVGASTSRVPNPNWAPPLLVRSQANFWAGVMGVRKTASSAAAAPANLPH